MIVYLVRNTINDKVYVGQTRFTAAYRWNQHKKLARLQGKNAIHCAIRKYGAHCFLVEILATVESREQASELEKAYIAKFRSAHPRYGYNCTSGGEGGQITAVGRLKIRATRRRDKLMGIGIAARWAARTHCGDCGEELNAKRYCTTCRREYMRKWREQNVEKFREYLRKCYAKKRGLFYLPRPPKLSDQDVDDIRASTDSLNVLAGRYHISKSYAGRVKRGERGNKKRVQKKG